MPRRSAVRQKVLLHVLAVRLEEDARAAKLADLLVGPLDHTVTLALLRMHHLPGTSDLEALLGARLGLHLGHFARLRNEKGAKIRRSGRPTPWRQRHPSHRHRHGSP